MHDAAHILLLYIVIPAWLLAGLADWWCHRVTQMATTSGLKENIIHLLMFGQGALALLAGLFLEINAGVLLLLFMLLLHELTAIWDLNYAYPLRAIPPIEQHIHSFLEVIPFLAMALVCIIAWPQLGKLITGASDADFTLRWKSHPLPQLYLIGVLCAALLLDVVAYVEEFYRCLRVWRAARRTAKIS